MLAFVLTILKTTIFSYFLNYYLKRNYPEKYNEYLISLSYNVIYISGLIQIKFKKYREYIYKSNPRLANFINEYKKTTFENIKNVEFILNGKVFYSATKEVIENYIIDIEKPDFIIYSDYNVENENNCINKKIINNLLTDDSFICEPSNIKFILCELIVGDKKYKIDYKSDNYNYYIVDNIINRNFVIYYLLNHYSESILLEDIINDNKLILKIIDHNMDDCEIDITDNNYLQIKKDNYITN